MSPPRFNIAGYLRTLRNPSPYQTVVILEGNPLVCDCFAGDLKERLVDKRNEENGLIHSSTVVTGLVFQDFSCPEGVSVGSTEYQDLTCPIPGYGWSSLTCPDTCTCQYSRYYSRVEVRCEGRNLTTLPSTLPIVEAGDTIALYLANNSITNIGEEVSNTENIDQVEYLDLTGNLIDAINHTYLPTSLSHLLLANNNISTFPTETLQYFENHNISLSLAGNPFTCSCNSSELVTFLQREIVRDTLNITIKCPHDIQLYQATSQLICYQTAFFTHDVIIYILGLLTIIIFLIVLVYYHRTCTRHICPVDDSYKEYDAFISYSHHDADYVERELYPTMAQSYKCCIHTLHWEVGRMIPDQIVESVEHSRRTIIVLSMGYIQSTWTRLEFQAAHKQAVEDGAQV